MTAWGRPPSLKWAPVCGSEGNDSRPLHPRPGQLLSLSGPQFPYLQNGRMNTSYAQIAE